MKVPGFGLPVDYELDKDDRFRHGATDITFERMTAREQTMLGLMEALTDKPDWSRKVFDESITSKWREEAMQIPRMSEKTFDWCLTELKDKAKGYEATNLVTVLDMGSRCVKTDRLIPPELKDELKAGVKALLDSTPKDWHPGSEERVLNLVHPSLFTAVYGKTLVLNDTRINLDNFLEPQNGTAILPEVSGETSDVNSPEGSELPDEERWSVRFQWLPCDVSFTGETDTSVKIDSYINNLHPNKHAALYHTIEALLSLSIPAWNQVLVKHHQGRTPLRIKATGADTEPEEEPDWFVDIEDDTEEIRAKFQEYMALPNDPDNLDPASDPEDCEDDPSELASWKFRRIRKTLHPEPGVAPAQSYADWKSGRITEACLSVVAETPNDPPLYKFEYTDVKLEDSFRKSGLQVIVKLASIELTPDKPSYPGGNWHIEGMLNEHIVATSIYYYDVSNITKSRIRFRQEAKLDATEVRYAQNDHWPLCTLFGTDSLDEEPAIQELGSIATPENRLLAFPNTLQHQVQPFALADPTKPGHRRFLVLWLVDPHYRILSTSNVPPQQHEWWTEKADKAVYGKVPREVQTMIGEQMRDSTMTLDEAKEYRLQLMAERTIFTETVQRGVDKYNFCEH